MYNFIFTFSSFVQKNTPIESQRTGKTLRKCTVYGKRFTTNRSLRRHVEAFKSGEKSSRSTVKGCISTHTEVKEHKCFVCSKVFTKKQHLVMHLNSHAISTHNCNKCHKRFILRRQYTRHILTHLGEKAHKCGSAFVSKTNALPQICNMWKCICFGNKSEKSLRNTRGCDGKEIHCM